MTFSRFVFAEQLFCFDIFLTRKYHLQHRAPVSIQNLLEPHLLSAAAGKAQPAQQQHGKGGKGGKGGNRHGKHGHGRRQQQQQQQQPSSRPQHHLLDGQLQRLLQASPVGHGRGQGSVSVDAWKWAAKAAAAAKTVQDSVVPIDAVCAAFFSTAAAAATPIPANQQLAIVMVTAWALQRRAAHRVSHVLVGEAADGTLRLCSSNQVYIGAPYSDVRLAELAGDALPCVSSAYASLADGLQGGSARQWREFFLLAGCNEGIRFRPAAAGLQRSEHHLLPDKKPPQLRKSAKSVVLPYGLGTLNVKQLIVVDCHLSPEWAAVLDRPAPSGGDQDAAAARGAAFCRLLLGLRLDSATHPDGKTTPAGERQLCTPQQRSLLHT